MSTFCLAFQHFIIGRCRRLASICRILLPNKLCGSYDSFTGEAPGHRIFGGFVTMFEANRRLHFCASEDCELAGGIVDILSSGRCDGSKPILYPYLV